MTDDIIKRILKNGGISLKLTSLDLNESEEVSGDYWYFPLFPDSTRIVDEKILAEEIEKFVSKHANELLSDGRYLGIWRNPDDHKYYVDINGRDETEGRALQRVLAINERSNRKILAIYNPTKNQIVGKN